MSGNERSDHNEFKFVPVAPSGGEAPQKHETPCPPKRMSPEEVDCFHETAGIFENLTPPKPEHAEDFGILLKSYLEVERLDEELITEPYGPKRTAMFAEFSNHRDYFSKNAPRYGLSPNSPHRRNRSAD